LRARSRCKCNYPRRMVGNLAQLVTIHCHNPAELVDAFEGVRIKAPRPSWQLEAECRGVGTEHYFGRAPSPLAADACQRCTVSAQCLDYALTHELFGWWAGTSERARRRLRKGITNPDPLCVAPSDATQGGH
jgi:hypothetical protein